MVLNQIGEQMVYDIFISYESTTGTSYAENLKDALTKYQKESFLARKSLLNIDMWPETIKSALNEAPIFIIIITVLTSTSPIVEKEYKYALKLKKDIIVCRDYNIPKDDIMELSLLHQIEFDDKYELANKAIIGLKNIWGK